MNVRQQFFVVLLLLIFLCLPCSGFAAATPCGVVSDKKVALVIGNSYSGADRISGIEDARVMSEYLCDIGFSVVTVYDGNEKAMTNSLDELWKRVANAEVVVFFYSGHGYQIKGVNYLLPVDYVIDPAKPEISIDSVRKALAGAPGDAVKLVFLDACRSNADLPVTEERKLSDVAGWREGLEESPTPPRTAYFYATDYGKTAPSGPIGGFSPFSSALLRSIREPGLEIGQFFHRVHDEVFTGSGRKQSPKDKGLSGISGDFYLVPPVPVRIAIDKADDDLFVLLNGKIVRSRNRDETSGAADPGKVFLNAGENELALMVYNQKSFVGGQLWTQPEGWSYKIRLLREDGTEIPCVKDDKGVPCPPFEDHEEVPFKNGAHHGKLFEVARAILNVDKGTAELKITEQDTGIWDREAPFESRDQGVLDEKNLREVVRDLLKLDLAVLGSRVAAVRGNRSLGPKVKECMNQSARRDDLLKSALAFLGGSQRPFDDFDKGLIACVGAPVSTSFEDR